jgi:hypothetical protein
MQKFRSYFYWGRSDQWKNASEKEAFKTITKYFLGSINFDCRMLEGEMLQKVFFLFMHLKYFAQKKFGAVSEE